MVFQYSIDNKARWYFGGLASAGAACCTHPLDLLKVHLQTQQKGKIGLWGMGVKVVKSSGIRGLYNGISASLLRQLTYSTVRFGIYEVAKQQYTAKYGDTPMPFYFKVTLAACAGGCGGVVGTPPDMVNVRMQNDMKIPAEQRRNYKHALDGLYRVYREEGAMKLMNGCSMASGRAVFMTIGQIAFYDQVKQLMIKSGVFADRVSTHLLASSVAAAVATVLTQPLDVMKTRMMNAPPGTYKSLLDCARHIFQVGPIGFYKGFFPAFVRLLPQTVFTFVFFEQLRLWFGFTPTPSKED